MIRVARCVASLLALLACANGLAAGISSFEVDSRYVVIRFDQPMLTWQDPLEVDAISIDPAPDCHWRWDDDITLHCEIDDKKPELHAATRYRLDLREGLWTQTGEAVAAQTRYADSQLPKVEASIAEWKDGEPQIVVEPNLPVDADALRDVLRVSNEAGDAVGYQLVATESRFPDRVAGETIVPYRIVFDASEPTSGMIAVAVKPGLRSHLGPLPGIEERVLLRAYRREPFRLRDWLCSAGWVSPRSLPTTDLDHLLCPAGASIALELSRKPDEASLVQLKRGLPRGLQLGAGSQSLPTSLLRADNVLLSEGWFVLIEIEQASRDFEIGLDRDFRSTDGSTLDHHGDLHLTSTDFPAKVNLDKSRLVLKPGDDVPLLGDLRNNPALKFVQHSLGAADLATRTSTVRAHHDNRLHDLSLPQDPPRELRRNGGLVFGELTGHGSQAFELANSPFHIAVIKSSQQLLVWVSDWTRYEARAKVAVELLRVRKDSSLEVLASGNTGDDGVAELDLTAVTPGEGLWMVRASDGERRSVVPVDHWINGLYGGHGGSSADGSRLEWGVTDRPLYRPGDTVKYRLWVRERHINRLAMAKTGAAIDLHLVSGDLGGEWKQWTSAVDETGSVIGEVGLPATTPDSRWCINSKESRGYGGDSGACFDVINYHASPLWGSVAPRQALAYDGETVSFGIEAGFYSGGGAAGAKAEQQSLLMPLRLEETFPEFGDFHFVQTDSEMDGGENFANEIPRFVDLDADGKGEVRFVLHNSRLDNSEYATKPIPFGKLQMITTVSTSPSNATTSPAAEMRVSRFRRFVGLKIGDGLSAESDPALTGILIDAEGRRVESSASIDVEIIAVPPQRNYVANDAEPETPPVLAKCTLPASVSTRCAFRAPANGLYRFTARYADAAATSVDRYINTDAAPIDDKRKSAVIERVVAANGSVQFKLHQPYAHARVFFAVQHGRVLKHWIATVDSSVHTFAFDLPAEWAPGVTLSALILNVTPGNAAVASAQDARYQTAALDIDIESPPTLSPLRMDVENANLAPGQDAAIRLRNAGDQSLDVTLAVVDEAVDALSPEIAALREPQSPQWLGSMKAWSVPIWGALIEWDQHIPAEALAMHRQALAAGSASHGNDKLETIVVTGSRIRAVDLFYPGPALRSTPQRRSGNGKEAPVGRSHFADTAYWAPALTIAPGAEHIVHVALPDNLTRWKIFAWSSAGAGEFHLDQASLSSSLPIEVRTELPVRLFPGDLSDIAIGARNHTPRPRSIAATLKADGAGSGFSQSTTATVGAERELRVLAQVHPQNEGTIDVSGSASAGTDSDAIIGKVAVASSVGRERVILAGWIGPDGTMLHLPELPKGADQASLRIDVRRELDGLIEAWIVSLRDYQHRCWEQQLSRAVGAAAALRLGKAGRLWPDAQTLIADTLAGAPAFQEEGLFRFFGSDGWRSRERGSPLLTAYTLQALQTLHDWGYSSTETTVDSTNSALKTYLQTQEKRPADATQVDRRDWIANSAALSVLAADEDHDALIRETFERWDLLDWYARSRLLLAASAHRDRFAVFAARLAQLREAVPLRAARRGLNSPADRSAVMGSNLRDQCTLIDTLNRTQTDGAVIDEWRRGLVDLYAGGADTADTQASAQCLMALLSLPKTLASGKAASIDIDVAARVQTLQLAASDEHAEWSMPVAPALREVRIKTDAQDQQLGVVAELSYRIDQRRSAARGVGLSIVRDYSVMRDRRWVAIAESPPRAGDWIRVHLRIGAGAWRHHVAVVDSIPGGLRSEDLDIERVAGIELRGADTGSPWFQTKQLVDTEARFYAEQLPPGSHDIYYYARAVHRGDFLALPARAELMYGSVGVAHTAAVRVQVLGAGGDKQP
ncbi:MAG: MG2 domain-containing protein [Tahibacter sp.]